MRLLLDACGLDGGSNVVIESAKRAMENLNLDISIIGLKDIEEPCKKYGIPYIIAREEITLHEENPAFAIRQKKDSSIVKGMFLVKEGLYDGFVSGGSTGALLAGGMTIIGRINGVKRACLMIKLPTKKGYTLFLDVGANVDINADVLKSFAIMADRYFNMIEKRPARIRLLNNGIEKSKGTILTKETYALLENSDLNFLGNIEARDLFDGECDVVITDGFTGNIFLKSMEGLFKHFLYLLKETANSSFIAKLALGVLKKPLKKKILSLDATKQGGVPLLGLKKTVVKAHGSSDVDAFYNSIIACKETIESNLIDEFYKSFNREEENG